MSTTIARTSALVIVPDGAPDEDWQDGRAEGVTASEIHSIAVGSMKARRAILDGKLNGSTFHGNQHTKRGHELEPVIIAAAAQLDGVTVLEGSNALLGHPDHPLHRATPDGLGHHAIRGVFGAEVKRREKTSPVDVPADHYDQCQFGMWVTGLQWWLYAWKVEGEDGIHHRWIERDEDRIAVLARQADDFIAWRAAGAPSINGLPDDIDDALAEYARGLAIASEGEALKKAARVRIDAWIAEQNPTDVLRREGSRASLTFTPKTKTVLDEDAWTAHDAAGHANVIDLEERAAMIRRAAENVYSKTVPATPGFRIAANGDAA